MALTAVNLGVVGNSVKNRTRMLEVPFLTNNVDLEEKEELIVEVLPVQPKEKRVKKTKKNMAGCGPRKGGRSKEKGSDVAKNQQQRQPGGLMTIQSNQQPRSRTHQGRVRNHVPVS